ncbi:MAG: PspA/IM30 family protein [Armatimonadota bacterium]
MILINPFVTFIVILAGMSLIIYQAADKKPYGIIGSMGLMLTGITYAAWMMAGTSGWTGIMISAAGVMLMYMESRITPGHGIFAVIGTALIFAGTYNIFGGSQNGVLFPMLMAILISGSSALAFIIHLPNNAAWKEMRKQIKFEESVQSCTIQINTSKFKAVLRQKSFENKQKSCQVKEQTGVIEKTPVKDTRIPTSNALSVGETIESLRMKLAEIETYAIPVIANWRRLEHKLNKTNETLAKLESEAQKAVEKSDDNLASEILLGIETCKIRAADLKEQLSTAKLHSDAALQHIEEFRNSLAESSVKALNAESKDCILIMQAQFKQMTSEDMRVIDELEERADGVCSEADVLEAMSAEDGNHQRMKKQFADRKTRADKALNDLKTQIHGSGSKDTTSEQDSQQQTLGHD